MEGGGVDIGRKKRLRPRRGRRTGEGKKSKLVKTTGLNSNGSPKSSPELIQGYNYPPKCRSVARLASEAQVTPPPHRTEPLAHLRPPSLYPPPGVWWHSLIMTVLSFAGKTGCFKLGWCLSEWMGQFTGSIGHEILWFTVAVMSLADERCRYIIDTRVKPSFHSL